MSINVKIGQVWRSRDRRCPGDNVVIIAVSENKVFVHGYVDYVDPEITIEYLLKNYDLDSSYGE